MNEELVIYGFGSFFCGSVEFQDIDILIVHRSSEYESCQFAIWCKQLLTSKLIEADITILSEREERQFSFSTKSNARHLGNVYQVSAESDLYQILKIIKEQNCKRQNNGLNKAKI